jgi:hypothetical protein
MRNRGRLLHATYRLRRRYIISIYGSETDSPTVKEEFKT